MLARVNSGRIAFSNVVPRPFGASCAQYLLAKSSPHTRVISVSKRRQRFSCAAIPLRSTERERILGETRTDDNREDDSNVPTPEPLPYEPESPSAGAGNPSPSLCSLLPVNASHASLTTFISHARHARLNPTTYTYLGTRYEYLAQEALSRVGLELLRIGKAGDRGVDLAGLWHLPSSSSSRTQQDGDREHGGGHEHLRVLVQCKRIKGKKKVTPAVMREMDGAFLGAPAGWRGENVFGIVVSTKPATKGVIAALGASRRPLVWICMEEHDLEDVEAADESVVDAPAGGSQASDTDEDDAAVELAAHEGDALETGEDKVLQYNAVRGRIIQLLYNNAARQMGLEGLDVVKHHDPDGSAGSALGDGIVLVYRGRLVPGYAANSAGEQ